MIVIDISLDKTGILKTCRINGHAEAGPKGTDIVCAAVSILARTTFNVLAKRNGVEVLGGAPGRGVFFMEIKADKTENHFISAISDFFLEGLRSVSKEYPDFCTMNISTGS